MMKYAEENLETVFMINDTNSISLRGIYRHLSIFYDKILSTKHCREKFQSYWYKWSDLFYHKSK